MDKDFRRLIREAVRQGFRYQEGKGGAHGKLYSPDGKEWYAIPNTPSDRRAILNLRAWLRRHGFVEGKGKR